MTLGAAPSTVRGQMLREAGLLALVGVVVGVVVALSVSPLIASMAFSVAAIDPIAFMTAPLVLLSVALMAALVPAVRAAGTDPVSAIRADCPSTTSKRGCLKKVCP